MYEKSTFISDHLQSLIDTWCSLTFENNELEIIMTIGRDFSTSTKSFTFSWFAVDLVATCL